MRIYDFMKSFNFVISLNYDLIVYWALMEGNNKSVNRLKDCFTDDGRRFHRAWQELIPMYGEADGSTLAFYPHGNLALATGLDGTEFKVTRGGQPNSLLNRIVREWRAGDAIPLFVSEGESSQKRNAISRNGYLSTVFNEVLPKLGESIVVYGWSLSENDDHIAQKILKRTEVKRIAISVYTEGQSLNQISTTIQEIERKVKGYNYGIKILFFDSRSPGCWIYPGPE